MSHAVCSSYTNVSHCMQLQYQSYAHYAAPILMCHTQHSSYINVSRYMQLQY